MNTTKKKTTEQAKEEFLAVIRFLNTKVIKEQFNGDYKRFLNAPHEYLNVMTQVKKGNRVEPNRLKRAWDDIQAFNDSDCNTSCIKSIFRYLEHPWAFYLDELITDKKVRKYSHGTIRWKKKSGEKSRRNLTTRYVLPESELEKIFKDDNYVKKILDLNSELYSFKLSRKIGFHILKWKKMTKIDLKELGEKQEVQQAEVKPVEPKIIEVKPEVKQQVTDDDIDFVVTPVIKKEPKKMYQKKSNQDEAITDEYKKEVAEYCASQMPKFRNETVENLEKSLEYLFNDYGRWVGEHCLLYAQKLGSEELVRYFSHPRCDKRQPTRKEYKFVALMYLRVKAQLERQAKMSENPKLKESLRDTISRLHDLKILGARDSNNMLRYMGLKPEFKEDWSGGKPDDPRFLWIKKQLLNFGHGLPVIPFKEFQEKNQVA